jgi:hypothetical protein
MLAARLGAGAPPQNLIVGALLLTLALSALMASGVSPIAFGAATLCLTGTSFFTASLLSGLAAQIDPTGRLPAIGAGIGFVSEALGPALGGTLMEWGGRHALVLAIISVGVTSIVATSAASKSERKSRATTTPGKPTVSVERLG